MVLDLRSSLAPEEITALELKSTLQNRYFGTGESDGSFTEPEGIFTSNGAESGQVWVSENSVAITTTVGDGECTLDLGDLYVLDRFPLTDKQDGPTITAGPETAHVLIKTKGDTITHITYYFGPGAEAKHLMALTAMVASHPLLQSTPNKSVFSTFLFATDISRMFAEGGLITTVYKMARNKVNSSIAETCVLCTPYNIQEVQENLETRQGGIGGVLDRALSDVLSVGVEQLFKRSTIDLLHFAEIMQ